MNKILKYILFRTVLVIITLHTIIPHPHSIELTDENHIELHKKSNSIIGIIKLVLHESDDESLDNLIICQNANVNKVNSKFKNPAALIINKTNLIIEEKEKTIQWYSNDFIGLISGILIDIRGPPSFIFEKAKFY